MSTTFLEWVDKVSLSSPDQGWRLGQHWYHELIQIRPTLAQRVLNREGVDPFYLDDNMLRFLEFVQDLWNMPDSEHEEVVNSMLTLENKLPS